MIKEIIWLSVVFLVILALCVLSEVFIINETENICLALAPMETALAEEDWDSAGACLSAAKTQWDKAEKIWRIVLNHDDMRDIEIGFVDMEDIISRNDRENAPKELADLLFYLRHVPESEKVDMGNLL